MNATAILEKLIQRVDLTAQEAELLLDGASTQSISGAQLGAILVAMRMKGETAEEVVGLVTAMRRHMTPLKAAGAIDVCGTGGDGAGTFNISTTCAFVVTGAGARVAKHGNRAASSQCGSADVLEELGVNIALSADQAEEVLREVGMVFLFAPSYHPALKEVAAARKALGVRTIFNVLGPFASPAGVQRQFIGVPNLQIAKLMAEAGSKLRYTRLIIATSADGLDELSTAAVSTIFEVTGEKIRQYEINPVEFGFAPPRKDWLAGGDARVNATVTKRILSGQKGPERDIVILNSAMGLYAAGVAKNLAAGIGLAERSIDSGNAEGVLKSLVKVTQSYA